MLLARSMFLRGYAKHILILFINGPQIETIIALIDYSLESDILMFKFINNLYQAQLFFFNFY